MSSDSYEYDIGDGIRLEAAFYDEDDDLANPSGQIVFRWKEPDGTITSLVSGTDAEVVHDGTGLYHIDRDLNAAGVFTWRWKSTGTITAASEGKIRVRRSAFETP